ncbi:hypothetical protein ASE63_13955 [Bosea sp. Root381]|nr:hypothetical protein ASE63_13955 [Bosea sp. Root381]
MIRCIVLGSMLATAALLASASRNDAFACSRTAGCAMKHDGRMDEAIRAGRDPAEPSERWSQPSQPVA